jgi:FkbM family methyltransferase
MEAVDVINKKTLELYLLALKKTEKMRRVFDASKTTKIFRYPLGVVFMKIIFLVFPQYKNNLIVKNKLFFGDGFYTRGQHLDYYVCGFIAEESEIRLTKFLINQLKTGDTFFDVGANFGFFSVLANHLVSGGGPCESDRFSVHAFEPASNTYLVLKKNSQNRIITNELAVADFCGERDFFVFEDSHLSGLNSFFSGLSKEQEEQIGEAKQKKVVVQVVTLDQYCKSRNTIPSFVKIDVEGAEFDVIKGGETVFSRGKIVVIMEIWPSGYNANHIKAAQKLISMGYDVFTLDAEGLPVRSSLEEIKNLNKTQNVIFARG